MIANNKLPNAIEVERMILASILTNPNCFSEVSSILTPKCFYDDTNRIIYENLLEIELEGKPIDVFSLLESLKMNKLIPTIGMAEISRLASEVPSGANIKYHSRLVFEKSILREIIFNCRKIESRAQNGGDSDVFQFLSDAEGSFNKINSDINFIDEQKERPIGRLAFSTIAEIRKERDSGNKKRGMAFITFPTMNKQVGGLMPGDLVGIYGREKSTKSTLAFSLMLDLGMQGIPGVYFSYEMLQDEIIKKGLSLQSGVEYNKMRNPSGYSANTRITDEELQNLENSAEKLKNNGLIILDEPLNEYQIAAKLKQLIKRDSIKVAVIDYLMLVNSAEKFKQSYEELNYLSKFFKRLAMQLKIAIIVVSQADYSGERTAQGLGLQRDSNYFYYIEKKEAGSTLSFYDILTGEQQKFTFSKDQYLVTLRGSRHSVSNRSFVVQYVENQYKEVDISNSRMPI